MVAMDMTTRMEAAETAVTADQAVCPAVTAATGEAGLPLQALLSRAERVATEAPVSPLVMAVTEVTAALHYP